MIMKGCSLDLCLSPVTSTLQSCSQEFTVSDPSSAIKSKDSNAFYNGRLSEYDIEEIQIRAIIEMASKEREATTLELELGPVRLESPLGCPVKRSVKRFLEKRKKRSQSVTFTPHTSASSSSSSPHHF